MKYTQIFLSFALFASVHSSEKCFPDGDVCAIDNDIDLCGGCCGGETTTIEFGDKVCGTEAIQVS